MTDLGLVLCAALVAGLAVTLLRLPPLVGFLVAGFALNAGGVEEFAALGTLADLGIALLLFGIGLKLDIRVLARREVWVTSSVHMVLSTAVATGFLALIALTGVGVLGGQDLAALVTVGFALSFSSTVLVIKLLEQQGAAQSRLGQIAIGILLVQDIAAVAYLALAEGSAPSPYALLLVLLIPAAIPVRYALDRVDHGELIPLFGVALALGPGYALFDAVGLKGDLGALVVGLLLASDPRAGEMSKALFSLKELLLIAFFLSVGFTGLPTWSDIAVALLLLLLIPVKGVAFVLLLRRLGIRHRTSVRAGVVLGNYSEFALIVAATATATGVVSERWLVVLATALAMSSLLSVLLNQRSERLVALTRGRLDHGEPERLMESDRPIDIAHADAVVFGMGRVGQAAYHQLEDKYGLHAIGIENSESRVSALCAQGLDVIEADATDPDLWDRLMAAEHLDIAILAMPFHGANTATLKLLEKSAFQGTVAAVAQYDDEAEDLRKRVDAVLSLYDGAGHELADDAAVHARLDGAS